MSGEVQLATGPQAGGVLGWFDGDPAAGFIYPETTGYYLTFLSFLGAQYSLPGEIAVDALSYRARHAAGWLGRWSEISEPPTRVYLAGPQSKDWRNHLSFSFDLAMIWRGLATSRHLAGDPLSTPIRLAIERRLSRFCLPQGGLLASAPIQPGPLAQSWSVQPGSFQMKPAAALLYSGVDAPLNLHRSAEAVLAQFRACAPGDNLREFLHPNLYAAEGALLAGLGTHDPALLRQAAAAIENAAFRTDIARSDALAQVLRCGCILHAAGYLPHRKWSFRLPELAAALCRYCAPDGRMYFQRGHAGSLQHVNVWCGLFAAQALIWYGQWRASALSLESAAWLV